MRTETCSTATEGIEHCQANEKLIRYTLPQRLKGIQLRSKEIRFNLKVCALIFVKCFLTVICFYPQYQQSSSLQNFYSYLAEFLLTKYKAVPLSD